MTDTNLVHLLRIDESGPACWSSVPDGEEFKHTGNPSEVTCSECHALVEGSSLHPGEVNRMAHLLLAAWQTASGRPAPKTRLPLFADMASAAVRDKGPVPWCVTCEHHHIADMPPVTYQCHDCGFGQWSAGMAAEHAQTLGHRTYRVGHVLIRNTGDLTMGMRYAANMIEAAITDNDDRETADGCVRLVRQYADAIASQ